MIIGLTGNLGSGKSTVARFFEHQGAKLIDVDKVAHELYKTDLDLCADIAELFGDSILGGDGSIIRKQLAQAVFADEDGLRKLSSITNDALRGSLANMIADEKDTGDNPVVVIEAAILIEAGWDELVDKVIVVIAPRDLRAARCLHRGMTIEKIETVLRSQLAQHAKIEKADFIIDNSDTLDHADEQVKTVWEAMELDALFHMPEDIPESPEENTDNAKK